MNSRTDFADEMIQKKGKDYNKIVKNYKNMKMTIIDILNDNNQYGKEKGKYISIDFKDLYDQYSRQKIENLLIESLKILYQIKESDKVLIVGLGNQKIIADSLGPSVADKIMVTNHLFTLFKNEAKDIKRVCVFTPKVMGQTGLESADLIEAVNQLFKPNIIIVIDALASSSITRINKVIQLSNTGIAPGSGVGNYRKEINEKRLKTKVIAIGVATVVEANKIIEELHYKAPDNQNYHLVLTPKEIDEDIQHLSNIIANSINKYIHSQFKDL